MAQDNINILRMSHHDHVGGSNSILSKDTKCYQSPNNFLTISKFHFPEKLLEHPSQIEIIILIKKALNLHWD